MQIRGKNSCSTSFQSNNVFLKSITGNNTCKSIVMLGCKASYYITTYLHAFYVMQHCNAGKVTVISNVGKSWVVV
jgi:hypothetical protein